MTKEELWDTDYQRGYRAGLLKAAEIAEEIRDREMFHRTRNAELRGAGAAADIAFAIREAIAKAKCA